MQEILLLFWKGIKNKKGSFLGIFILMLLMSMTLISVLTIRLNFNSRQQTAVKEDGYGEVVFWISDKNLSQYNMSAKDIIASTISNQAVDKVESSPYIGNRIHTVNGKKENSNIFIQELNKSSITYTFFDKNYNEQKQSQIKLKENEAAVPLSYVSSYHCKLGDKIFLGSQDTAQALTIAAFFEDPYMGTSIMGIKTVLVNEITFEHLNEMTAANQEDSTVTGTMLNVHQKTINGHKMSDLEFVKKLNQENQISGYADFSLTNSGAKNYMLILTNIFSGILVAFLFILLIITIIIISHSISNSIEMEYKDIGILKAMGVSAGTLQIAFLLQYFLAMLAGCLAGIIPAVPVIAFVNRLIKTVVNLAVSKEIAVLPCLILEAAILLLLSLFTLLKLAKMKHIRPLQAIREGNGSIYFKSRLQLPIKKSMLSLSLALRQLVTGKKNYIGVSCIAAILFFFLILINGMAKWGGDGGKNVISMFSNFDSDISINYLDPGIKAAVETQISQLAGTKASFYDRSEYIMINGVQMHATAINDPKEYTTVYQGRTCSYENEILITQYVADEFHIGIGDKIVITKGNQKAEYMVSGIYQCANDMGANIAMSLAGLEKLKDSPEEQAESGKDKITRYTYEYKLKDSQKKELLISTLKKKYMATQIAIESDDTFNGMSAISSAIKALSFLVYLIAAVFTMVTIALVSGRIIKKETKDYGIFKSIGYTSSNLRLQIAFRMGITAGIGGLFGIILVFLCGKKSIMFLLHFMGVYHYNMQIHVQSLLLVFIGLVLFFIFVTYLFTRKIKGISVKMLMAQ